MFSGKSMIVHKQKKAAWSALIGILFILLPTFAYACSCVWKGPFLEVWKDSPLIVWGTVIRHHPDRHPSMDVLVLETLKGGLLDSGMVVQMGDGMHCRPTLDGFPPGSSWILALNGPGAKPGKDLALSHCGEYWLRVENGEVVGSIDGTQSQVKRMALGELKRKIRYPHFQTRFKGHADQGKRFSRPVGSGFSFLLEPTADGWEIHIREVNRDENLARFTPPLHFVPNPREIEGWHFAADPAKCASHPYQAESAPGNSREFIFSPEVGKSIDGPNAARSVTANEIEDIRRFGRGVLTIEKFQLEPGASGCPRLEWINFSVGIEGGF